MALKCSLAQWILDCSISRNCIERIEPFVSATWRLYLYRLYYTLPASGKQFLFPWSSKNFAITDRKDKNQARPGIIRGQHLLDAALFLFTSFNSFAVIFTCLLSVFIRRPFAYWIRLDNSFRILGLLTLCQSFLCIIVQHIIISCSCFISSVKLCIYLFLMIAVKRFSTFLESLLWKLLLHLHSCLQYVHDAG